MPTPEIHRPYVDDGVTYCGFPTSDGVVDGCGHAWPCPTIQAEEDARVNMRRRAWTQIGNDELIRLLDLPAGTTVLAVQAGIDPPAVKLALHNPAWPVQPPDVESPFLPYQVELSSDGLKRIYGVPPEPTPPVATVQPVWPCPVPDCRETGLHTHGRFASETMPPAWEDPTHGRIDPDIQRRVEEMEPSSLGQRVAMEQTLQDRRGMRWLGCPDKTCQEEGPHMHNEDGDAYPIAPV